MKLDVIIQSKIKKKKNPDLIWVFYNIEKVIGKLCD